jgi:hypothetical protein
MRGDAERKCLEAVQRCIFESSPFRNETAYTVSEDEFFENYYLYAKPVEQIFFGMSEDDIVHFENLLRLVKPNSAPSEFPDFTSDRGFVEHFQVSSSEITKRAGALHKKEYAEFQKVANQKERQLMDEMNEHPESGKIETLTQVFTYPRHSYEYFCTSFKKTWEHHAESLDQYGGCKDMAAFMIEYQEHTLHMCEDFSELKLKEKISYGDLLKCEHYSYYRLSRDKNILNYIYGYKDKIDYVVMVTGDELPEIIKVENIPELLKLNPHGFLIESTMCMSEMRYFSGMSVHIDKKDGEPNE